MKIDLRSKSNKSSLGTVRSQIKDKGDLKKFDEFIAKHETLDLNNDAHIKAARGSCPIGGTKCVITTPPIQIR